jgi:predicted PurR-regulated permease PerM
MPTSTAEFSKRTIIVIALALVPVLVWLLFDLILIILGAVLIALTLQLGAEPLHRWLRLPQSLALILAGVIIVSIVGGGLYLFGTHVGSQLQDVLRRVDAAERSIRQALQGSEFGKLILSHFQAPELSLGKLLGKVFTLSAAFLASLVVLVVAGIYLAAQPLLYREGLNQMFPPRMHPYASMTIEDIAWALRRWLLGQLIQMVIIGACSGIAVWLIGLPTPWALGLIAGIAEFVPYLGPVVASIPAIFVAATVNLNAVLWTVFAYIIIHQTESHLVTPLIQRQMVSIPPAVMVLAIVAIGLLFGPVAMIFAAPMTVVLFVVVKKSYKMNRVGIARGSEP